MKKLKQSALWVLAFSFVALFSCNDPSVIGSDLLSGDELDIAFTDTLTIQARTVPSDSLLIWNSSSTGVLYQNFSLGDMQDPIFGRSVASIYAQIVTNTSAPKFNSITLDSVVLMLAYNASLCYGSLDEPFTIEVYELDEALDKEEDYYTTDSFAVKPAPLAIKTFVPNVEDSVSVLEPQGDDGLVTKKYIPHLRIRLDDNFGKNIVELDSLILMDDSSFIEHFRGIWLKPASQNAGMLNFSMRSATTNMRFYYHTSTDTSVYDFKIFSTNPVTMHQRNYYEGSVVAPYISQPGENRSDSLLFLQGLKGLNIELEIPYAEQLKGAVINKAELILPIVSLPEDTDDFDPVTQMYVNEMLPDTTLNDIADIYLTILRYSSSEFGEYFGGQVEDDDDTYRMSVSAHVQKMVEGEVSNKILITPYLRQQSPRRVVLGGPGHSTSPAKLKITYTRY